MKRNRSEAEWATLMAQFDPMKQSVRNFCKQQEISPSSFYVQRKKAAVANDSPQTSNFIEAVVKQAPSPKQVRNEKKITLTLKQCELTLPASYLAAILRALL